MGGIPIVGTPDRIVTVSTISATVPDVERFVQRSLSSGVDHMLAFLDQPQPAVRRMLDANQHVTVVPTAEGYWHGQRPESVEDRQYTNANVANAVLATVPSVRWLYHLDYDEALWFDRSSLLRTDARAVRFPRLEVVAARDPGSVAQLRFKKIPTQTQLLALAALGAIDEPDLDHYFRAHTAGKTGVRPDLGVQMGVHVPRDTAGNNLAMVSPPDCHLLHYDSWCLDDFVNRWRDFGPKKAARSNHRERRKQLGLAVNAIVRHPVLDEPTRMKYLDKLFSDHIEDDAQSLERLGLIVEPTLVRYEPKALPKDHLYSVEALLQALRSIDKAAFGPGTEPGELVEALQGVARELDDKDVADQVLRTTAEQGASRSRQ